MRGISFDTLKITAVHFGITKSRKEHGLRR